VARVEKKNCNLLSYYKEQRKS